MNKALLINAHQYYEFTPGKLNQSLLDKMEEILVSKGYDVQKSDVEDDYDVAAEIKKFQWADVVIFQAPVNWMGVPWKAKKYIDEVFMTGTDGSLCNNDGRSSANPKTGYGSGGTLNGKKYMMSLTFNAPIEAFNNPDEYLFQGKSVDDLFFPMHMNFRFLAMEGLPTFVCYDVMKNPTIEDDFNRLEKHMDDNF